MTGHSDHSHYLVQLRDKQGTRYVCGNPAMTPEHPGWVVFAAKDNPKSALIPEADILAIIGVEYEPPFVATPVANPDPAKLIKHIEASEFSGGFVVEFADGVKHHYQRGHGLAGWCGTGYVVSLVDVEPVPVA